MSYEEESRQVTIKKEDPITLTLCCFIAGAHALLWSRWYRWLRETLLRVPVLNCGVSSCAWGLACSRCSQKGLWWISLMFQNLSHLTTVQVTPLLLLCLLLSQGTSGYSRSLLFCQTKSGQIQERGIPTFRVRSQGARWQWHWRYNEGTPFQLF